MRNRQGAGRFLRPLAVVTSTSLLLLAMAGTAFAATVDWEGNGWPVSTNCQDSKPGEMLWIYTGNSDSDVVLTMNGVTYTGHQQGQGNGSWHIVTPYVTVKPTASVAFTGDYDPGVLTLSHGCPGEASPTPTPSESQSATPTPSETPTPTPSPTPEGSVAQGTSTPTPEGSVQGGTGTPEPSQPDTAMGVSGGPSPIPTVAFGLILLAALGTLAWANVKSARHRA